MNEPMSGGQLQASKQQHAPHTTTTNKGGRPRRFLAQQRKEQLVLEQRQGMPRHLVSPL
jgi:hypothetical protein